MDPPPHQHRRHLLVPWWNRLVQIQDSGGLWYQSGGVWHKSRRRGCLHGSSPTPASPQPPRALVEDQIHDLPWILSSTTFITYFCTTCFNLSIYEINPKRRFLLYLNFVEHSALFRSLIRTGTRRNPAACGKNQGDAVACISPPPSPLLVPCLGVSSSVGVKLGSFRKVYVRLPGKVNSKFHGARPVHLIIPTMKWIRTSRLSIKNSLSWTPH